MKDPIQRRVRTAVSAAMDKKASDLDVLAVSELTSIADYFVICTAQSERQAQAIADGVQDKLRSVDSVKPLLVEGTTFQADRLPRPAAPTAVTRSLSRP